jgi:predicted DNA binding CopG/RHH family protein
LEEWEYSFDPAKNAWLVRPRGTSFEQIISLIECGSSFRFLLTQTRRDTRTNSCMRWYGRPVLVSQDHLPEPQGDEQAKGGTEMKKRHADDDEKELVAAYEAGEFKSAKNQNEEKRIAVAAAKRYMRKDARINIRLSTADLEMLKRRAVEEGLPYQSLIASVLHKYVSVAPRG